MSKFSVPLKIDLDGSKWTIIIHYNVNWTDLVWNFKQWPKSTIMSPNELLKSITHMTDPIWSKICSIVQNQPLWEEPSKSIIHIR